MSVCNSCVYKGRDDYCSSARLMQGLMTGEGCLRFGRASMTVREFFWAHTDVPVPCLSDIISDVIFNRGYKGEPALRKAEEILKEKLK